LLMHEGEKVGKSAPPGAHQVLRETTPGKSTLSKLAVTTADWPPRRGEMGRGQVSPGGRRSRWCSGRRGLP
jgi:hypothetical protein